MDLDNSAAPDPTPEEEEAAHERKMLEDEDALDALNDRKHERERLLDAIWDAVFTATGGHEGPGLTPDLERRLDVIGRRLGKAMGLTEA